MVVQDLRGASDQHTHTHTARATPHHGHAFDQLVLVLHGASVPHARSTPRSRTGLLSVDVMYSDDVELGYWRLKSAAGWPAATRCFGSLRTHN